MAMGPSTSQRCDAEPLRPHRPQVWALLCLLAGRQAMGSSSASANVLAALVHLLTGC